MLFSTRESKYNRSYKVALPPPFRRLQCYLVRGNRSIIVQGSIATSLQETAMLSSTRERISSYIWEGTMIRNEKLSRSSCIQSVSINISISQQQRSSLVQTKLNIHGNSKALPALPPPPLPLQLPLPLGGAGAGIWFDLRIQKLLSGATSATVDSRGWGMGLGCPEILLCV